MGTLKIELLGTSFSIKASEDDNYLKKLLGYYKNIVNEIQKSGMLKSELHISILAGIMLCDELYKEKSKSSVSQKTSLSNEKAEKLTSEMIKKLDQVLKA
ncbi:MULTISPECIES: cell division protein ZapA [unclassified Treponema]|uniref:cell division protein ZapA n=1 Tax=unclassified Treponema TaxID=2638727 RepID=UPI0025D030CE|nr:MULTISPECIES: cell division protein ZapA [unclassified Treponema]